MEDEYTEIKKLSGNPVMYDKYQTREYERIIRELEDQNKSEINQLKQKINQLEQETYITMIENDWTEQNEKTVKTWQEDIQKTSFVYGEILSDVTIKLRQILIALLCINAVLTLLSTVNVALEFLNIKWLSIVFNITTAVGSAIVTVLAGLIKIYNWEDIITTYNTFIGYLDTIWFNIETELSINSDQRMNAKDFIKRYDGEYMYLMRQCPSISGEKYSRATRKYKQRMFEDQKWSLNFKQRIKSELSEIKIE